MPRCELSDQTLCLGLALLKDCCSESSQAPPQIHPQRLQDSLVGRMQLYTRFEKSRGAARPRGEPPGVTAQGEGERVLCPGLPWSPRGGWGWGWGPGGG